MTVLICLGANPRSMVAGVQLPRSRVLERAAELAPDDETRDVMIVDVYARPDKRHRARSFAQGGGTLPSPARRPGGGRAEDRGVDTS